MNARLLLIAIIGLSASALEANATIMQLDYSGTVVDGIDQTGVFAAPNTDLSGYSFTARFVFDTEPFADQTIWNTADRQHIDGSTAFGGHSPAISAELTINGHTFNIGGAGYGVIDSLITSNFSLQSHRADDDFNDNVIYGGNILTNSILASPGALLLPIDQAYYYSVTGNDVGSGSFLLYAAYANVPTLQYIYYARGDLAPTTVTATVLEQGPSLPPFSVSVPEPTSWALMTVGLGSLGVAMRKRRFAQTRNQSHSPRIRLFRIPVPWPVAGRRPCRPRAVTPPKVGSRRDKGTSRTGGLVNCWA